jgi:FAD/FMN-containing dehydrogenase
MLTHGMSRRAFFGTGSAALAAAVARRQPAAALLQDAHASLTGRVIWPGDSDYDTARLGFNARFSRFPVAIVVCDSVRDVQNAIRWARQHDLPFRVRSGGHSYEGFSTLDDGLVIDVGGLQEVSIDPERREAIVGAGVRLLECYRRLWAYGVTIPGGTCPGVGIAGLTLGGGIGFLSRQYGLTCDNLLAVDLVDGNGVMVRASAAENADLFWAMRGGGGGNFGIATAFTFRVHPIAEAVTFSIAWPWDDAAAVIGAWQRWAPFIDERLAATLIIGHPSAGSISSFGLFTGSTDDLPGLLDPLLGSGTPWPLETQAIPFLAAAEQLAGPGGEHAWFKNASAFAYDPLPPAAIATLLDHLRAAPSDGDMVGLFPLGGAIASVDPRGTAFPHRRALFDLQYQAYWWDAADDEQHIAWIRGIREAMLPYTRGAYVNYIDADVPDWESGYYGPNRARLRRVKAQFDPDNVFSGPRAIPAGRLDD